MNKKHGTTLIEVIVSIAIIIVIITICAKVNIKTNDSFKLRAEYEELNRLNYCIMQEVKYNYTISEVTDALPDNYLELENSEDFLEKLLNKPLFDFPRGDDIKIYIINNDTLKLHLKISVKSSDGEQIVEREFKKYCWMDEL